MLAASWPDCPDSPEQHKMLQKADEHGTCLDLEA